MFRRILNKTDRIQLLSILILSFGPVGLSSAQVVDMDQTSWHSEGDNFTCRLRQPVNNGYLEFVARAGYPLSLTLFDGNKSSTGTLSLLQTPPPWKHNQQSVELGKGPISPKSPYQPNGAEGLFQGLINGYWGKIVLDKKKEQKAITLSNTGIYKPASAFQDCRNKLLPASFDQLSLLRIQFSSGKSRPQPKFADDLNNLAAYVREDKDIEAIYVDGYTDGAGHHLDNLQIAKDRAENVARYLTYLGIPEEKIKTRFHAERYPVATNNTAAGRAKNRRVEVRLIRKNTPPDPKTFFSK
ncbi:OmpA family protein [Parendozoicomonas sp. Alg238-R29]|uniref:OmpA family protein n=1 Tax=Parendozoicomonas sp. Alg238-R29 TaxID=2993446 RepID=UPI00248E07A0|nr:OmpA family protein [Parendozoicomonas sp. Alg238-R29]